MSPTIRVDDEVYGALQREAVPFVDTPNSVLRRKLGLGDESSSEVEDTQPTSFRASYPRSKPKQRTHRTRKRKRAPTGTILPESEYELPMLRVLESHGGQAPAGQVIAELGEILESRLMPNDYEALGSGGG